MSDNFETPVTSFLPVVKNDVQKVIDGEISGYDAVHVVLANTIVEMQGAIANLMARLEDVVNHPPTANISPADRSVMQHLRKVLNLG